MTDRIGVWKVNSGGDGRETAEPLKELKTTETEERLEELLVASPDVLISGLTLIGRQITTSGGPLDLLGVDGEGRIVLFELKRGLLTRDAVAQILDYASDLMEREPDEFAALIEGASGQHGIDEIDDFLEWYQGEYQHISDPPLDELRLVLVGLGVDDRARRIVNFLASSGIDIQLLTFQAFQAGSEVLLARRVETVAPRIKQTSGGGGTKIENRRHLEHLAHEHGVGDLLIEVADFIEEQMPPSYRWPGKTSFSYSMRGTTEEGRPSQHTYVVLWVDQKSSGRLLLTLPTLTLETAPEAVNRIVAEVPAAHRTSSSWKPFELPISAGTWPDLREPISQLLKAIVAAWQDKAEGEESDVGQPSPSPDV